MKVVANRIHDDLVGVWIRKGIAIGDNAPLEDSQVVYFQAPTRYGDIRVATHGERSDSFAGTFDWKPPGLTFHHELELNGEEGVDFGRLENISSDLMVEFGSVEIDGETIHYQENWQRQTRLHPQCRVLEQRVSGRLTAIVIEIEDHLLYIEDRRLEGGDYSASYHCTIGGHQQLRWSIGEVIDDIDFQSPGHEWDSVDPEQRSGF